MTEKENCKNCCWLTETLFKRNDKIIYYCNNLKYTGSMEKTLDFKKCKLFNKIT